MNPRRAFARELQLAVFAVPAVAIYLLFFLMPVLSSLYYSVFDFNLLKRQATFVGFSNFTELLTNTKVFSTALVNNIKFTAFVLVFQVLAAFVLALLLFGKMRVAGFFKALFFYPVVLSSVAVTFVWIFLCDSNFGTINGLLKLAGLGFLQQNWLGDPRISLYTVATCYIWQHVGFHMVIFYAGLQNIPLEMYEAARIEGAGFLRETRSITIPMLMPATTISVVLSTVGSFKIFDLVFIMTGGGPYQSPEVLAKTIYSFAFEYNRVGFASAVSVVLLVVTSLIGFAQLVSFRILENRRR